MKPQPTITLDWDVDPVQWAEALEACPGATFFHTDAWLATAAETFNSRIVRVRADLGDGRYALLPLSIRPLVKGLLPMAVAGETGAYCGLVSPQTPSDAEVDAVYAAVRRKYPNLQVMGNPFATGPHVPELAVEAQSTHILQLAPFPELRQGFSRGAKSRGNKARKQGYELVVGSDIAAVDAFYPIYEDSVKRWGDRLTWARPYAFFERLVSNAGGASSIYLAKKDGQYVSGLLFVTHGDVVFYVAGASLASELEGSPSNYLMEEALANHAAAGFKAFDFGPSNGLGGVTQFKEGFGAKPVPFYSASARTLAGRAYFALRAPLEKLTAWRDRPTTHDAA